MELLQANPRRPQSLLRFDQRSFVRFPGRPLRDEAEKGPRLAADLEHRTPALRLLATGPRRLARPKAFAPWNGKAAGTFGIPYMRGRSNPSRPGQGEGFAPARRARCPSVAQWRACPRTGHLQNRLVPDCSGERARNSRKYETEAFV